MKTLRYHLKLSIQFHRVFFIFTLTLFFCFLAIDYYLQRTNDFTLFNVLLYLLTSLFISLFLIKRNQEWSFWMNNTIPKIISILKKDWFSLILLTIIMMLSVLPICLFHIITTKIHTLQIFIFICISSYIYSFLALLYSAFRELYFVQSFENTESHRLFYKELCTLLLHNAFKLVLYFFVISFSILFLVSILDLNPTSISYISRLSDRYFATIDAPEELANHKDISNNVISVITTSFLSISIAYISFIVYLLSAIKSLFQSFNDIRKEKFNFFSFLNLQSNKNEQ